MFNFEYINTNGCIFFSPLFDDNIMLLIKCLKYKFNFC
jgi:hypothetical protein